MNRRSDLLSFRRNVFALLLSMVACNGSLRPDYIDDTLIVSNATAQLAVLEVPSGRILGRTGPIPPFVFCRSIDESLAYYAGSTSSFSRREIVVFNVRSLNTAWRSLLTDIEERSTIGQLVLPSIRAIAPTADGQAIIVAPALREGSEGMVLLDAATGDPQIFLDSLAVAAEGLVRLPPGEPLSTGGLGVAIGRERPDGRSDGWLMIFDADLERIDSIQLTSSVLGKGAGIKSIALSPGGSGVLVRALDSLFLYDMRERRVSRVAQVPANGRIFAAYGQQFVLVGDTGDGRNSAGSGMLIRFTPDLARADTISLREAAVNGAGPSIQAMGLSRDERRIYVLIGDPQLGPLYPAQQLSVLVVDNDTKTVVRSIPLNEWGGGTLIVR